MIARTPLAIAGVAVFALAACDPTLAPEEQQRTRSGAAIGAIAGALAGTQIGEGDAENVLIGAAAGAALGGAIGQELDRQARDLRRAIGNDNITVTNTGSALVVTMPQDILFATDSAAVRPDLRNDLFAVAGNLQSYPDSTIQIVGHTDNTGSAAYNQDLSERRAGAVAAVLINAGVSPSRVAAFGRGEEQPVATNLTAEGRAQNRRVEIIIRPNR
ncbi:MAG: OmpA family protein [Rhodobacteraceae bacterium]|nr:OmpA family protein [Paracoccaceae bacterium]